MNLPGSLRVLGRLFNLVAIALLLPVPWSFWYGETRSAYAFLGSSVITGSSGSSPTMLCTIARDNATRTAATIAPGS